MRVVTLLTDEKENKKISKLEDFVYGLTFSWVVAQPNISWCNGDDANEGRETKGLKCVDTRG